MHLHHDPTKVFISSITPAGLYARQKWLGESHTKTWKTDFQNTVRYLLEGQSSDGSWGHSINKTIKHLFGLHLTVRTRTDPINKALEWLLNEVVKVFPKKRINLGEPIQIKNLTLQLF